MVITIITTIKLEKIRTKIQSRQLPVFFMVIFIKFWALTNHSKNPLKFAQAVQDFLKISAKMERTLTITSYWNNT